MQIVQLKRTINELNMKPGWYFYACTTNILGRNQREAPNVSRRIGRLWVQEATNIPRDQAPTEAEIGTTE